MTRGESAAEPARDLLGQLSPARKLAFVAATLVLLVLVWAIALEAAIRVFDIGPEINPIWRGNYQLSKNPALRYELAPGSTDGTSIINRHGMRDRDYARAKPPGVHRIAVIGDSIAFGNSVAAAANFSAQLEGLLAKYFRGPGEPAVEVLNFGVTGYSFLQVMETLRSRVLDFDPDVVVYAYALNDPQEYSLEMDHLLAQLTEAEERYVLLDRSESLLQRSRLLRLVRYLFGQRSATRREAPVWHEDDPQFLALREGRFAEYFAEIHRSPETWGPIAAGLDRLADLSAARQLPVHAMIFPLFTDFEPYPIPEVHARLRRAFEARSIPVLDLLDHFACFARTRGSEIAADALHPNKRGHALAAVALLHHLLSTGGLPGQSEGAFERLARAAPETRDYMELTRQVARAAAGETSSCPPRAFAAFD